MKAAEGKKAEPPRIEDLFVDFLDAVRLATDLTAVNIAAGTAWIAYQQIEG